MVGWHHQFKGPELGQILGDGERQGGLACWHAMEAWQSMVVSKSQTQLSN